MNPLPLEPCELELLRSVLRRHPKVVSATLFGSRAKGSHTPRSDVDLALAGDLDSLAAITHTPLLEHIKRVGMVIYPEDESAIKTSAQSCEPDADPIAAFRGSVAGGSTARLLAERQAERRMNPD